MTNFVYTDGMTMRTTRQTAVCFRTMVDMHGIRDDLQTGLCAICRCFNIRFELKMALLTDESTGGNI